MPALCALLLFVFWAESWTGRLIDVDCVDRQEQNVHECSPNSATTHYGIELRNGRTLRFDDTGNARAAEITTPGRTLVRITGSVESGDNLHVFTIDVR
jgi:hypothetical protein